jgi:hypothetical protein
VWSASATIDADEYEEIGFVKRNTGTPNTAARRVSSSALDLSPTNAWSTASQKTLGMNYSGTTLTLYDAADKTTKNLNGSAQNAVAFSSNLVFGLGAWRTVGTDPTYQLVQTNLDYMGVLVFNAAISDATFQTYRAEFHAINYGVVLT